MNKRTRMILVGKKRYAGMPIFGYGDKTVKILTLVNFRYAP